MGVRKIDRIQWIDIARMIGIFCVVLCHSIEAIYPFADLAQIEVLSFKSYVLRVTLFTIGRLGVPLFLMITGYLLLDRDYNDEKIYSFWKKNWFHLLCCTWIWFFIYEIYLMFYGQKFLFSKIFKDILFLNKPDLSHVWYLPMILGMYLTIPFVAIVLKHICLQTLKLPILVYGSVCFLFPTMNLLNTILLPSNPLVKSFSTGFSGGEYGLYIVIGYLVKKKCLKRFNSILLLFLLVLSVSGGIGIQLFCASRGHVYNIWYDSIFILLASTCLFECISRIKFKSNLLIIEKLSEFSFSIYLIHNMIKQSVISYVTQITTHRFLQNGYLWLLCIVLSFVIAMAIDRIPKVGKIYFV